MNEFAEKLISVHNFMFDFQRWLINVSQVNENACGKHQSEISIMSQIELTNQLRDLSKLLNNLLEEMEK